MLLLTGCQYCHAHWQNNMASSDAKQPCDVQEDNSQLSEELLQRLRQMPMTQRLRESSVVFGRINKALDKELS